jgi:hypothetical protein
VKADAETARNTRLLTKTGSSAQHTSCNARQFDLAHKKRDSALMTLLGSALALFIPGKSVRIQQRNAGLLQAKVRHLVARN